MKFENLKDCPWIVRQYFIILSINMPTRLMRYRSLKLSEGNLSNDLLRISTLQKITGMNLGVEASYFQKMTGPTLTPRVKGLLNR